MICFSDYYSCDKCKKLYKNKNTLRRHERYECDKDPQFKCTNCLKMFYRQYNCTVHMSRCKFRKQQVYW